MNYTTSTDESNAGRDPNESVTDKDIEKRLGQVDLTNSSGNRYFFYNSVV